MKTLIATLVALMMSSAFAVEVTLPSAGSYIVRISSPESCTPRSFNINPSIFKNSKKILETEITPVSSDEITITVCRAGYNTFKGLFEVAGKTKVIIPEAYFGRTYRLAVEEITRTKTILQTR